MRFSALPILLVAVLGSAATAAEEMVLTARPGLCIVKDAATSACLASVELSWQAPTADNYCLHSSLEATHLACWDGATTGKHVTELVSRDDVRYWMQRPGSEQELAPVTVRILSLAQKQPNRRRRRHAWTWL